MKKLYSLLLILFFCSTAFSQTFTNSTGGSIIEVGVNNFYPVTVSGLPSDIDSFFFGLKRICFDIEHTYDSDLDIMLMSPDGSMIMLSNNNGGDNDNFTGTCVKEDATDGEISAANAPFSGVFFPDESVNNLNNGQNPNGIWNLIVIDEVPSDTGDVISFSITFGLYPPPTHEGNPCEIDNAIGCDCPDGSQNCDLLPNMINSEKYILTHYTEYNGKITMGVATPNIGWGPLELHGTTICMCDSMLAPCSDPCPNGDYPEQGVVQTIYHKDGAAMTSYNITAGTMSYHPNHGHIHVDNWTYNTLRIRGADPDARTWPVIAESDKQSFCLINLGTCSSSNEYCRDAQGNVVDLETMSNGGLGNISGCGYDQGIYVGKYDAYDQGLDGQEIDFDDLCNGQYYLVSITDPNNIVVETDDDDNWVAVLLNFTHQGAMCCEGSFRADTTYGLAPFQVQFIDSTIPVADGWMWDFGDGNTSTDQFPQHVYTAPGVYTVKLFVTTSAGCIDTIVHTNYITVDFGTGMPSPSDPSDIRLKSFPNPFSSSTSISLNLETISDVHLYLTDVVGNVIKTFFDGAHPSGTSLYTLDAYKEGLSSGIYFIHAEVSKKDYVEKLVVQKE